MEATRFCPAPGGPLESARTEFRTVPEYVALDLETTGLDPHHDRVIEVGAVAFTADRVLDRLERLVDPGRSVPEAVQRLTGIRAADLRQAGAPGPALAGLAGLLRGREPVGHGATLDIEFLAAAGVWPPHTEILHTPAPPRLPPPPSPRPRPPPPLLQPGPRQPPPPPP